MMKLFDGKPVRPLVFLLLLLIGATTPCVGQAAEKCKAKVDSKSGEIQVSAKNVGANPLWGVATAAASTVFDNEGTCFGDGKLKKCTLGATDTLAAKTPPGGCEIFVTDDSAVECSAFVKGCTPAVRGIDVSFPLADPRRDAGLEEGHGHDDYVDVTGDDMTGLLTVTRSNDTALEVTQNLSGFSAPPAGATISSDLPSGIGMVGTTLAVNHSQSTGVDNIQTLLSMYHQASGIDTTATGILIDHGDLGSGGAFEPIVVRDNGSNVARIDDAGTGYFNGGTFTSGADFAESVKVTLPRSAFEPGDVIAIDSSGRRMFTLSETAESTVVAGIYSTKPGIVARPGAVAGDQDWQKEEIPLAITGIVPCKVSDEGGTIRAGDLLVSASRPGYAKRAPEKPAAGTLIGKALEPLTEATGTVEVLLTIR